MESMAETEFWPVDVIIAAGFASIMFNAQDLAPDDSRTYR